jgi:hypothetical protein
MQALPDGHWTLVKGDKWTGQLIYRDETTGTEVEVPSVWYNQPITWRIEYFRYCAQRARECAARMLASTDRWKTRRAAESTAQAKQLDADADTMERTGKFV